MIKIVYAKNLYKLKKMGGYVFMSSFDVVSTLVIVAPKCFFLLEKMVT